MQNDFDAVPETELPDEYRTGIDPFDTQHSGLFSRLSLLAEDAEKNAAPSEYLSHIKYLIIYAKNHLTDEEEMMRLYNYPLFEVHKKEHDEFREYIENFMKAYDEGAFSPEAVVHFVRDWFVKHILETDMRYVEFFKRVLKDS